MRLPLLRVRGLLAALSLALLSVACGERERPPVPFSAASQTTSPFASTDITGAPWGRDFHLLDAAGTPRTLADYRGKAVMLFFGYTHCPDMCPTALAQMAAVRAKLGAKGDRVQGLFVTVDPKRDTPEVLARYAPGFDPSFVGLYADEQTTAALAKDFKVYFAAQKPDAGGNYTVDHNGGIYVFDPAGRLRLMMRSDLGVAAMAADVARLLQEETPKS